MVLGIHQEATYRFFSELRRNEALKGGIERRYERSFFICHRYCGRSSLQDRTLTIA